MVSLDEIARDPGLAVQVPAAERNRLIARCAAIVMALTCTNTTVDTVVNQPGEQTAVILRDERLLTVDQAAEILGFATSYVYELLRRAEICGLHHGRYWRIRRSELERFIAANEKTRT